MRRHILRGVLALALIGGASVATLYGQQLLRPLGNLRLAANTGGALAVVSQGECGTLLPQVTGGNIRLSADATGALYVCGDFGSGTGDIESVAAGNGLTGGGTTGALTVDVGPGYGLDVAADTVVLDLTEILGSVTFGDGSTDTIVWTFNRATGTDPTITFNSGSIGLPALTLATPLAAGQGGTGLTAFTQSGNTTEFGTVSGAKTSGDCVEFDASGNLVAAGAACGAGGSGDIEGVTAGSGLTGGGTSGTVTLDIGEGLAIDVSTDAVAFDPTELLGSRTFGDGSTDTIVWTFNRATGTDPTFTFNSGSIGVPDLTTTCEAYDATGWNGSAQVPCQDAVRDIIETFISVTDPDGDYLMFWDDSDGSVDFLTTMTELVISGNTISLADALDLGSHASLEIPNAAAPTVDAFGEIAGDNNLWASGRGTALFYDGTAATAFVNVLVSDSPSNGQVPKWNTGGTITWENDSTGSGLGTSLTSSTNDILASTGDSIVLGKSGGEAITLDFGTSNTLTLSSTTGLNAINFGSFTATGLVYDAEGTNNTLTIPTIWSFETAVCQGSTASLAGSTMASLAPTPVCITGTNVTRGAAQFPDSDGEFGVQYQIAYPFDGTGTLDVRGKWRAAATSGDVVFQVATACTADAEVLNDTLNTASTTTDTAKGTTLQVNDWSITSVTITGCTAGELLSVKVFRQRTHASDSLTGTFDLFPVSFTIRRGM